MSLFEWSTPERCIADQILPIIPNEIYICIFEYIVPPAGRLTPDELRILANLSRVCRFFAEVCLPRIFEFVEFSACSFCSHSLIGLHNDATRVESNGDTHTTWREAMLCTQIAAKQPLALSLAQTVRSCHFVDCDERTGVSGILTDRYLAGMLQMKNIREVRFSHSYVVGEHWRAISTLELLEELSFNSCIFPHGWLDVLPGEKVILKVSHLRVRHCTGHHQPVMAIDPQYLRILDLDFTCLDQVDWLPQSGLIELCLSFWWPFFTGPRPQLWYPEMVHTLLMQPPKSLSRLWLSADLTTAVDRDKFRSIFADPAWKNLSFLRSLTLGVILGDPDTHAIMLSFILDCVSLLTDLQSFTLKDLEYGYSLRISPTEVRRILHDTLGPSSSLTYAGISDKVFRLVDGEWWDASCSTA